MNSFFFVRHGQTDANAQKLLCGSAWDIALNAEGQRMALEAAAQHKTALANVTLVCSSPLLRARQTAQAFADALHLPITLHEDLKEQFLGVWERQPWDKVPEFFAGTQDLRSAKLACNSISAFSGLCWNSGNSLAPF